MRKSWYTGSVISFLSIVMCLSTSFAQEDTSEFSVSCHCLRNLTPAGIMISHVHPKNEWMFSYRLMEMSGKNLMKGSAKIDANQVFNEYVVSTSSMRMGMHMLMGMVGVTDRLTVMGMVNYVSNSMQMDMLAASHHHMSGMEMSAPHQMKMNTNGFSDTKLTVLYGLLKNSNAQLVGSLGINIPTGSIQQIGLDDDMLYAKSRLPYMMQFGSGTFDLNPSMTYAKHLNSMAFSIQTSGNLHLATNKNGYRLGDEWLATAWFGYNWWSNFSSSIRVEGMLLGKIAGYDRTVYAFNEPAANPNNYGGKRISVLVGTAYQFEKGFLSNTQIGVEYGLPVYQVVNGIQTKLNSSLLVNVSYSID